MRAATRMTVLAGVLAIGGAAPAAAQDREGFFLGFGAGWGSAKVDCDLCNGTDREGSVSAHVRLGTTLSERLSVGAELNAWFDSQEGDTASLWNATAAFYLYPAERGLFVKAGAGLSRADFEIESQTVSGVGLGLMAGVGYDFPIGTSTALTPVATFWYGKPGDLKLDGIPVLTGYSHNVFEVGVGLTFY